MEQKIYHEFATLEGKHWWFVARRRYLRAIIERYFGSKDKMLFCEVGCGTGGNLRMLAENATVDAVEMNDKAREQVGQNFKSTIRSIHSGYLPDNIRLDDNYDGVFALDVIEHVEDDLAALNALANLTSEDGLLVTTVPAYQWLWSEHDVANHHFRRYSKTQYCQLFNEAELEILYASYFNSVLFPLAALTRLLNKLIMPTGTNASSALTMPHRLINKLLTSLFSIEQLWAGKLAIPFGLSIVVVARPKNVDFKQRTSNDS